MIVQYTPAGGEPENYDARSLRASEASIAQRTIGMKWGEIEGGLDSDDPEAMRVIIWVIKKRSNPALRFSEFDPLIGEMTTRMDRREVTEYIENAFAMGEADPDVSRDDVVQVLQRIVKVAADPEHAERLIAEMAAGPKEPASEDAPQQPPQPEDFSPSNSTPTSTSSEGTGSHSSPTSSTSHPEPSTT